MNWFKRNIRYFVLSLYLLTNGVIIAESSLSGGPSGARSSFISLILSVFINKTVAPVEHTFINVDSLTLKDRDENNIEEGMTYYIPVGVTRRLIPEVLPENATDKNVTWSTSNKDVLEVYPGGLLEARSVGENVLVKVTPSNPANTMSFYVNVHERLAPPTFSAVLTKDAIDQGTTSKLVISADEREYDINKLTYFTNDPGVATINEYGVIKGNGVGETEVGVVGHPETYTIKVNAPLTPVIYPTSINLDIASASYVYDKIPLNYSFDTPDVTDQSLTFVSSNDTIARVIEEDNKYFIYGYKINGEVTITAYLNTDFSIFTTHTMTINNVIPSTMTLSANKLETGVGSQITLTPTLSHDIPAKDYLNVTNSRVNYVSSDESIAKVTPRDLSAQVIGFKTGTVTITATSEANPSLSATITLKIIPTPFINDQNFDDFNALVRKGLGHYTFFFISGFFGFLTFYFFTKEKRMQKTLLFSLLAGLVLASLSEFIQLYVPLRAGSIIDVLINFSGYLTATLLLTLIVYLINKKKIKKDARD